jgi:hypothetical protein
LSGDFVDYDELRIGFSPVALDIAGDVDADGGDDK